ncbi:MAG: dephospho-CoA kinase [Faecalibacterium sp.]|nr:dephospho-CoA kinase [Ruminococcus sp.]MCM1391208.1 dephospho-CoA kinase [Ruminococcus sp.]MCM1485664.1 dephospho-CoA kinase [Faecalibacterium sp.]
MKVYGLTGKSGAGKSTAAKILAENGFYIIDGDKIAHQITEKGSPILPVLAKRFGEDILTEGILDRKKLAARAFSDEQSTNALNTITHPEIDRIFKEEIAKAERLGFEFCVIDAAALLESPSRTLCEKIIVVTAPEQIRLERILRRDGISSEQALTRINAQKKDEYYIENADIIIRNYPPYVLEDEIIGKLGIRNEE